MNPNLKSTTNINFFGLIDVLLTYYKIFLLIFCPLIFFGSIAYIYYVSNDVNFEIRLYSNSDASYIADLQKNYDKSISIYNSNRKLIHDDDNPYIKPDKFIDIYDQNFKELFDRIININFKSEAIKLFDTKFTNEELAMYEKIDKVVNNAFYVHLDDNRANALDLESGHPRFLDKITIIIKTRESNYESIKFLIIKILDNYNSEFSTYFHNHILSSFQGVLNLINRKMYIEAKANKDISIELKKIKKIINDYLSIHANELVDPLIIFNTFRLMNELIVKDHILGDVSLGFKANQGNISIMNKSFDSLIQKYETVLYDSSLTVELLELNKFIEKTKVDLIDSSKLIFGYDTNDFVKYNDFVITNFILFFILLSSISLWLSLTLVVFWHEYILRNKD